MNLKKIGKVFTSKFVGTGPSSYKKRIYRAAVSQRLRNTAVDSSRSHSECTVPTVTISVGSQSVRAYGRSRGTRNLFHE